MILARVAVAKSSRSAASSEDLSGTFYRVCRKTAPRAGAVSSLSDLCSPHDAYAPCPLLAGQRLASHRLPINSNQGQTSTGGPSQACQPNQPEIVSQGGYAVLEVGHG